jgi:calpain
MHSKDSNEFWSALLEKAYAKFYGSYEFLRGGNTCEAQEDFTGGVAEIYYSKSIPLNFFTMLEKSYDKNALMGCSMDAGEGQLEAMTPQGLVMGHAYSITKVKMIDIEMPKKSGKIEMIRMRNPWGNEVEWKGAWGDKSKEWQFIPEAEKELIGLTFDSDGEFWMSYKDFLLNFDSIEICNLLKSFTHTTEFEFEEKKNWHLRKADGEWKIDVSAGGCRNFLESFHTNPKFILKLNTPDADDDDGKCSIIVALMQKNRRRLGMPHLSIGFLIYDISDLKDTHKFDMNFFTYNVSIARSNNYLNIRANTKRCLLLPGKYLIMPTTFEPNHEGEFLLRVISESSCELKKI